METQSKRYSVKSFRLQLVSEDGVDPRKGSLVNDHSPAKSLMRDYFKAAEPDQERTVVILLNARNRLMSIKEVYAGTIDKAVVEPRGILVAALMNGATSMILAHNHPSGDPNPSREDREFTRRLFAAGETVGVRLLDHIVVGGDGEKAISFREEGLM